MDPINEAVEVAVRDYLNRISIIPREDLIALAGIREVKVAEVNYKQAVSEFNDAQRQVDALEAEALKALTGENQLDLGVVNSMLLKQKARMDAAAKKKDTGSIIDFLSVFAGFIEIVRAAISEVLQIMEPIALP